MNTLYMWLAGLLSGIIGAMGLGGGGVLIVYLTFFAGVNQLEAQGINLMFFIPIAVLAVVIYVRRGSIKLRPLIPYVLMGVLGAVLGTYLGSILGEGFLGKLFGAALIILGIKEVFRKGEDKKVTSNKDAS